MARPLALLLVLLLALPAAAQSRALPPDLLPARLQPGAGGAPLRTIAATQETSPFDEALLLSAVCLGGLVLAMVLSSVLPSQLGGSAATARVDPAGRPMPGR